ncbi:AAA family ATPase [Alkalicella caledoniensis]|uniref:endopeptidase La n=1 Tax=Alkalicella caledoniensis TaxID=2731377 RepID=A0A7G9WBX4_ALKCA|nr:ATP-binding protein [Alkalicella caledoniensis]QNO16186.1 AAA family ATPase [Alkalicella caledoniensis]
MSKKLLLSPQSLTSPCHINEFDFQTTEDLEPLKGIIGQDRAVEALSFGLQVKKKGYNIYVAGTSGTGRSSYANSITESLAKGMEKPKDWLYVYNFKKPDSPKALSINSGEGERFKKDIECTVVKMIKEIPSAFDSSDYHNKRNEILRQFQQKSLEVLRVLNEVAEEYGFVFKDTENGLVSVPLKNGKSMSQKEYNDLSPTEIKEMKERSHYLARETNHLFQEIKQIEEEFEYQFNNLDKIQVTQIADYYVTRLLNSYRGNLKVRQYIVSLRDDIVDNIEYFKKTDHVEEQTPLTDSCDETTILDKGFFKRYKVNLFVNNKELKSAPIINENNPSLYNLNGFIEYRNEMGTLKTDFTQIKPGSIHMANGGFLLIQAKDLMSQPFAWDTLKRAIKTGVINIENTNRQPGDLVISSMKPEPIPIDLKIIIIGDINLYHALYIYDEDFRKLFKIMADFDVEIIRSKENVLKMAKFIANHCKEVGLRHFDKTAVGRVIEYCSRLTDHQEKISSQFNQILEILYESDTWAEFDDAKYVNRDHVEKAIKQKIYRNSKYEDKLNEMFEEGSLLMDVTGSKVGQINGLAVMGNGQYFFGKPSRITVSTYKGKPGIINIEREAKKSGSLHDKGILILSGYLGSKYAQHHAMSLSVSISFEQNYSLIDGDSASSAELYAIISSMADVPIKQSIAVTGSVNQKGEIQPIGGVNEKIEGFYDVCAFKGLNGEQGVIIPKQNVKNLMLKQEVIDSVKKGQFHIYAIGHVDEGIEILTKIPAGAEKDGEYPKGTINFLVMKKLESLNK